MRLLRVGSSAAATGFACGVAARGVSDEGLKRSTTVVISGKAVGAAWLSVRVRSRGGVFLVWSAPFAVRVGFS